MKIKTMPKEIACELLTYIAEKEDFTKVCDALDGDISAEDIKALLREIAVGFQGELSCEKTTSYDVKKCGHLSKKSKEIISCLSPREEEKLLKAFGLIEKAE